MQLGVGINEPTIEIIRDCQFEGLTGSFIEYTFHPDKGVKSFDVNRLVGDISGRVPFLDIEDYTHEEFPAVVVRLWCHNLDPFLMNEHEAYEAVWPFTRVMNAIDIEEYIIR